MERENYANGTGERVDPKKSSQNRDRKACKKRTASEKPLPLIGPITYYLPARNGFPCSDGLSDEWRLIVQAEFRIMRGEFAGVDRFYAAIRKDGRNFLTAAGIAIFGAVGLDDRALFDTVLKDIAEYPSRYGAPETKLAVDIVMVWLRNLLHAPAESPSWLDDLDLSSIPGEWRRQVGYLAVHRLNRKGENKAAVVLADALLYLGAEKEVGFTAANIYLKMAKAMICRDEKCLDESERWCRAVVESARPLGIVLPFLGLVMGPKSMMERALLAGAPELLRKVKKMTNGYFRNLIRFHNRFTGDSVTEDLRPREFYIAGLVKRGVRYKEIAERTGMSEGRVRNTISEIYDILHVGSGSEIGDMVW